MKIRNWSPAFVLVGALALVLAGCSDDSATAPESSGEIDFDAEFGGFSSSDEQPFFGDSELEAADGMETEYDDTVAQDLEVRDWEANDESQMYAMTIRWGNLEVGRDVGASGDGSSTEWAGSLEVSEGAIRILTILDFEFGTDTILPRTDRNSIAWSTMTEGGFDGLRVLVVVPPANGGGPQEATVAFESNGVVREFSLEDLVDYQEVIPAGENGQQIAIRSILALPYATARGWTSGRWIWSPEDHSGLFAGRWVSPTLTDGRVGFGTAGFVRGRYGMNSDGEKVFFGKIIDRDGGFLGFVKGTWTVEDERMDRFLVGSFTGIWTDQARSPKGTVRGWWRQALGGSPGAYEGAWVALR